MTIGLPAWTRREAFKYVESLAGPLLAWEFLRRNPAYRNAWLLHDPADTETARRDWGLLLFVDPAVDGRAANPIWCPDPPTTLRLIPATGARDGVKLYDLDIDRSALHAVRDEAGTYLTALVGQNACKVHIADGLSPQDSFAIAINADAHAQQRAAAADRFIRDLGHRSTGSKKRKSPPNRAARFHASVLQALEGAAAGASHREIAVAIHGDRWVSRRWTPDGELRASIRYFLKRGAQLVGGDYRRLIYR
jgi:hypothetical protein